MNVFRPFVAALVGIGLIGLPARRAATESWGHINFGGLFPMAARDDELRSFLMQKCGMPNERVPLGPRGVGKVEFDDFVIEKLVYDAEECSSVPAHLYLPKNVSGRVPAVVLACGHGGSKSVFFNQYPGQLYAKAGLAVLATDPLGEEERDPDGRLGTRTHDRISEEAQQLGRPVLGKMVWDLMRGIDLLETRPEIDASRICVAGHSLGAIVGMYLAAMDERVTCAVLAAMYFVPPRTQKFCTKGIYELIEERLDYPHLLAMAAPGCAVMIPVGDDDAICGGRRVFDPGFTGFFAETLKLFDEADGRIGKHVYPEAGHRPYFLTPDALLWLDAHLGLPNMTAQDIRALPSINMAEWAEANAVVFEQLYGTKEHYAGMDVPDVGVRYVEPKELACLSEEERHEARFTAQGWLDCVKRGRAKEG